MAHKRGLEFFGFVFTAAVVALTYMEYVHNPFHSGNRRWVSWADSLWSMYCFRTLLPRTSALTNPAASAAAAAVAAARQTKATPSGGASSRHSNGDAASPRSRSRSIFFAASPRNDAWTRVRIVATAVSDYINISFYYMSEYFTNVMLLYFYIYKVAMKFGSGCVVSLLLMQVPVLFKGWRHFAFFMTAVALLQATSVVFDALEAHVRGAVTLSSLSEQLAPSHCSLPSHTCARTPSPLSPSYLSDHHPSKRSGIFVSLSLQPLRCTSCGSAFTSSSGWFQTRQGTGRCGPRQLSLLSKGPRFSAAQSDGAGAYTFHTLMTFAADIHLAGPG